jgi:prepilin-type N-terminal cleavage/methylation domain-containing protein
MKPGFTLIELIAVMLLVSILVSSATLSFVPVAQALMQVRTNTSSMQKSRLAVARLAREFTTISNVVAGDAHTLDYLFLDPAGVLRQRDLAWSGTPGDPLLLEGWTLTDDVGDFRLQYIDYDFDTGTWRTNATWASTSVCEYIEIVLQSQASGDRFTNIVSPRNYLFQRRD